VNKGTLEQQVLMERWTQRVLNVKQGPMVWQGLMEQQNLKVRKVIKVKWV
jgi:hypothetical protein